MRVSELIEKLKEMPLYATVEISSPHLYDYNTTFTEWDIVYSYGVVKINLDKNSGEEDID